MRLGERYRVPEIAFRFGRPFHRRRGRADFQIGVVFDRRGRPLWIIATVGVAGPGNAGPVPGHLALDCGFRLGRLVLAGEKKRMLDSMRNSARL